VVLAILMYFEYTPVAALQPPRSLSFHDDFLSGFWIHFIRFAFFSQLRLVSAASLTVLRKFNTYVL
jgi:hypothetical protein